MPHRNRPLHRLHALLDNLLPLLTKIARIRHAKAMLKHLADLLEHQPRHLGIEAPDQHIAQSAQPGVEPKRPRRRHPLHHGQERARHDHIRRPVAARHPHRAHGAHLQREEVRAHPRRVAHRHAVEQYEPDDKHQHDNRRRRHARCSHLARVQVNRDVAERDRHRNHAHRHAPDRAQEQPPAAHPVDNRHVDARHDEVAPRDHQPDRGRVAEPHRREQRRAVVHQCVEPGQLRDDHQPTRRHQRAQIRRVGVQLLDLLPARAAGVDRTRLRARLADRAEDRVDLGVGRGPVDALEDGARFLHPPVVGEVPRGLRAERHQREQHDGRHPAQPDHVPPAVRDVRERRADGVRDDLSAGDGHVVQPDKAPACPGGCDLRYVQWHHHCRRADA